MVTLIVQLLIGLIGLAAMIFGWWVQNNAAKKKVIEDEDKKIDSINNADDVIRDSGDVK